MTSSTSKISSLAPRIPGLPAVTKPASPIGRSAPASFAPDTFQRTPVTPPTAKAQAPANRPAATQPAAPAQALPQAAQVTGNGYGFAVFDPAIGGISKFYVHPYRFTKPNPAGPKKDGIETANVIEKMAWTPASGAAAAQYLDQSQVISAPSDAGTASYMMPFGLQRSALVTTLQPKAGTKEASLDIKWSQPVTSKRQIQVGGSPVWLVTLKGVKETMVVVPLAGAGKPQYGQKLTGASGWAVVSVEDPTEAATAAADVQKWQAGTAATALPAREGAEIDKWRVTPPATVTNDQELKLWRQSETVLRMGQVREANGPGRSGSGLILASLPNGEWFISWVRDMTYSTVALANMGHQDEARKALDAMLNARGVGVTRGPKDPEYQISTDRYFGNGAEEADYSGMKVRNVEYDSWGLSLWAFGNYFQKFQDKAWLDSPTYKGTVYSEIRDFVAAPLLAKLEPCGNGLIVAADTSSWEQNDDAKKHYAFSTLTAIAGLRNFLSLAKAKGDTAEVTLVEAKLALLQQGFNNAFVKNGEVHGSLEPSPRNDMDGALLEGINLGVITDPALIKSTLDRMVNLFTVAGGYRRVTGDTGYELQEFVWVDMALARALRSQGRTTEATEIEARLTDKANAQQSLIPEMYTAVPSDDFDGPIGAPTGAIPMVGYGAGAYIMNLLGRMKAQPEGT